MPMNHESEAYKWEALYKLTHSYHHLELAKFHRTEALRRAKAVTKKIAKYHTQDEADQIVAMRDSGMKFKDIAVTMRRSTASVANIYNLYKDGPKCISIHRTVAEDWPPTSDPWAVKIDFGDHNLNIKQGRSIMTRIKSPEVSLTGCATALCVGVK
jgi:hypothetical protein